MSREYSCQLNGSFFTACIFCWNRASCLSSSSANTSSIPVFKAYCHVQLTFYWEKSRYTYPTGKSYVIQSRGDGQEGKSPSSLLFQPISPSSLLFGVISPASLNACLPALITRNSLASPTFDNLFASLNIVTHNSVIESSSRLETCDI